MKNKIKIENNITIHKTVVYYEITNNSELTTTFLEIYGNGNLEIFWQDKSEIEFALYSKNPKATNTIQKANRIEISKLEKYKSIGIVLENTGKKYFVSSIGNITFDFTNNSPLIQSTIEIKQIAFDILKDTKQTIPN